MGEYNKLVYISYVRLSIDLTYFLCCCLTQVVVLERLFLSKKRKYGKDTILLVVGYALVIEIVDTVQ